MTPRPQGRRALIAAAICFQIASSTVTAQTAASAWEQAGAATAPIQVDGWSKPESGWLYVLDPHPTPYSEGGRIWLVDPRASKVMGSIVTGADPDFAISPDGSRLYVAAKGKDQLSNLAVIDTSAGTVLGTQTIEDRVAASGAPPYSTMFVSTDGAALRVLVNSVGSSAGPGFQLHSFDTETGDLLHGHIHLGNCGYGRLIADTAPDQFDFLCPTTNVIRRIEVASDGGEVDSSLVKFPWERRLGIGQIVLCPDRQHMLIARGDAAIVSMDVSLGEFTPTREKGEIQGRVQPAAWPASPDGSRIYLGYSRFPDKRFYLDFDRSAVDSPRTQTVDEFHVFDTRSFRKIATIKTHARFWTAVTAADGTLYATSPESHSVLVIDPIKAHQVGSISVGGSPTLVLVAP